MNKKAIVLLFAMFGLPVVIATLMHSQWVEWRPGSTRNHGTLINPVIEWRAEAVRAADGKSVDRQTLAGKWYLVYHTRAGCGESCLESLYWLRQVRLAQDRHVPEIGLLLIHEPEAPESLLDQIGELSKEYVVVTGQSATTLGALFPTVHDSGRYILDPMANIIMSYEPGQAPDDIRKDLGRLLTWTKPAENY